MDIQKLTRRIALSALIALLIPACSKKNEEPLPSDSPLPQSAVDERPSSRFIIGGFESDTVGSEQPQGWDVSLANGGAATFTVVGEDQSKSGNALKVEILKLSGENFWDIQLIKENIPVTPDLNHEFSAWVKGATGTQLNFAVETASYEPIIYSEENLTGDWQQVVFYFIPEVDSVRTPIHLSFPYNAGATIYLDEIAVRPVTHSGEAPVDTAAERLVFDRPPQGESPARWVAVAENGAEATFSVVENGIYQRSEALKVEVKKLGRDNQWDIQVFRENVPLTPQKIYNYSAWVKGPKGAQVNMAVEGPGYLSIVNKDAILTGKWQQVAFEFASGYPVVRTPIHFSFPYNEAASVFVDDVKLEISE